MHADSGAAVNVHGLECAYLRRVAITPASDGEGAHTSLASLGVPLHALMFLMASSSPTAAILHGQGISKRKTDAVRANKIREE